MVDSRGTHFDPDILDALVQLQAQVQEIAARFPDTDHDLALEHQRRQEATS